MSQQSRAQTIPLGFHSQHPIWVALAPGDLTVLASVGTYTKTCKVSLLVSWVWGTGLQSQL